MTDDSSPVFSVIVPTYKRPRLLADALESISSQTFSDFECLVVDDASGEEVVIPDDDRFRLIRREVSGSQAGAINSGIAEARGEYLAFLDDDDRYLPDRLKMAQRGFERAPLILCWGRVMGRESGGGRVLEGNVHDSILDTTTPQVGLVTVRRTRIQRFSERYRASADLEWWLRMSKENDVTTIKEVGHEYRSHSGSRGMNSHRKRIESSLRLLEEYEDYFRAHPKARAFRLRRLAAMAARCGDLGPARRYLKDALSVRFDPRMVLQLLRTYLPQSTQGLDS